MYLVKKTTRDSIAVAGEGLQPDKAFAAKHPEVSPGL
jgi:hypothetical protein